MCVCERIVYSTSISGRTNRQDILPESKSLKNVHSVNNKSIPSLRHMWTTNERMIRSDYIREYNIVKNVSLFVTTSCALCQGILAMRQYCQNRVNNEYIAPKWLLRLIRCPFFRYIFRLKCGIEPSSFSFLFHFFFFFFFISLSHFG